MRILRFWNDPDRAVFFVEDVDQHRLFKVAYWNGRGWGCNCQSLDLGLILFHHVEMCPHCEAVSQAMQRHIVYGDAIEEY